MSTTTEHPEQPDKSVPTQPDQEQEQEQGQERDDDGEDTQPSK